MTREELLRLFEPRHCTFDLQANDKDAALREILALVAPAGSPHHSALVDLLYKREAYGTTAAIKGVALPHGRSLAVNRLTGVFARSRRGIAFGAPDGTPTYVFIVLLSPAQDSTYSYLPALGRLVEILQDDALRQRLFEVDRFEDFTAIIRPPAPPG